MFILGYLFILYFNEKLFLCIIVTLFIGIKIINEKIKNVRVFNDNDFFGENAINRGFGGNDYGIESWKRIKDMRDNKNIKITNPQVITKGLGAGDIGQGQIGDCWFLSALSVVAYNRPDLLKSLIHEKCRSHREDGIYVIRFFKMGQQKIVYVDDRFP